jgi:glutathione S-transferase
MFAAEKGLNLPLVPVDLGKGENLTSEFLARNPLGHVPVLELDDGTCISESLAICEYLEDLHPDPSLIGTTAKERALTRMWDRRMELEVMYYVLGAFLHSSAFFQGRRVQVPAYADACREVAAERLAWIDATLADRRYVAGERFSIADITLYCTLEFGNKVGEKCDTDTLRHIARWHEGVSERPSTSA